MSEDRERVAEPEEKVVDRAGRDVERDTDDPDFEGHRVTPRPADRSVDRVIEKHAD